MLFNFSEVYLPRLQNRGCAGGTGSGYVSGLGSGSGFRVRFGTGVQLRVVGSGRGL